MVGCRIGRRAVNSPFLRRMRAAGKSDDFADRVTYLPLRY
jgi:hypothetical protein